MNLIRKYQTVSLTFLILKASTSMADISTIRVNYNSNPVGLGTETMVLQYGGATPLQAALFVHLGPAPCQKPVDCLEEFDDLKVGLDNPNEFQYDITESMIGQTLSFFAYAVTETGHAASKIEEIHFSPEAPPLDFEPDLIVHAITSTTGYVTDKDGKNVKGSQESPVSYPHVWAIEKANTGSFGNVVYLTAGTYAPFEWDDGSNNNAEVSVTHGEEGNPVVIMGELGPGGEKLTKIKRRNGSGEITIAIFPDSDDAFDHILWKDLLIQGSSRTAIHYNSSNNMVAGIIVDDHTFNNVKIDGGYNHKLQQDTMLPGDVPLNSKWGIMTWGVSRFRYLNGEIRNVKREHAFYIHNSVGDVEIRGNLVCEVGRTAVQITAREDESSAGGPTYLPPNYGNITIADNVFADTGLAAGDGFAGGKTITITGRNFGTNVIENNIVEIGHDTCTDGLQDALAALPYYNENSDRSTLFVTWSDWKDGHEGLGPVHLLNNTFRMSPKIKKHPQVVEVSTTEMAVIKNNTIESSQQSLAGKTLVLGQSYSFASH